MLKKLPVNSIALTLALLFHGFGAIGIVATPYKNWFVHNTVLNLLLMATLLLLTHQGKNKRFFLFFLIACSVGFAAEVMGVNTGLLFGNYTYGKVLGPQLFNVPLLIGINWFVIVYCTATATQVYEQYVVRKMAERGIVVSRRLQFASFVVDAALLIFLFDWMMEPVAMKLGYWQWENSVVPVYNYVCWIGVSCILFALFKHFKVAANNAFAVHLFIIQFLFFWILNTFL